MAEGLTRTTLLDSGSRLPHGSSGADGSRHGYALRYPSQRIEIAIGRHKADPEIARHPGKLVAFALAESLAELHGERFDEVKIEERAARVALLPYVDVIALLYARTMRRRGDVVISGRVRCPGEACGHEWPGGSPVAVGGMPIDLRDPWREPPTATVDLPEETEIQGLGKVRTLYVRVPSWRATYYGLSRDEWENEAAERCALAEASIVGTDLREPEKFVRPLSGYLLDVHPSIPDRVSEAVATLAAGPIPVLPLDCPKCKRTTFVPFGWRGLAAFSL